MIGAAEGRSGGAGPDLFDTATTTRHTHTQASTSIDDMAAIRASLQRSLRSVSLPCAPPLSTSHSRRECSRSPRALVPHVVLLQVPAAQRAAFSSTAAARLATPATPGTEPQPKLKTFQIYRWVRDPSGRRLCSAELTITCCRTLTSPQRSHTFSPTRSTCQSAAPWSLMLSSRSRYAASSPCEVGRSADSFCLASE